MGRVVVPMGWFSDLFTRKGTVEGMVLIQNKPRTRQVVGGVSFFAVEDPDHLWPLPSPIEVRAG